MYAMKIWVLILTVHCLEMFSAQSINDQGGPIDPCEENNQLVADKYSCTRYHVCRQLDVSDEFTTDIAICSENKVFDMVISECVDSETGFLQDPAGCRTFYGCHPTKETSEGFLRRHYTCPGDLRFNPEEKHCTFKTNVTDDLCNSRDPEQRIIGDVNRLRNRNNLVLRSNFEGGSYGVAHPVPLREKPSSILTQFTRGTLANRGNLQKKPPNPIEVANLNSIAQVINGQLLSLQNRESVDDKENELPSEEDQNENGKEGEKEE